MAMDLLRLLAACPLPAICHGEEIDAVRLLRAAGLVVALTPQEGVIPSHPEGDHAVVLTITSKGLKELQSFVLPSASSTTPQNGQPSLWPSWQSARSQHVSAS